MAERPVHFVAERFRRLEELATMQGLTIDAPRSSWDEHKKDAPLCGWLGIKLLHPLDVRSEDPDEAQPVCLELIEFWTRGNDMGSENQQGHSLVRCHYAGTAGPCELRYCYDPRQREHPEMHWHPTEAPKEHRPHSPVPVEETFARFEQFVFEQLVAGQIRE